MLHSVTSGANHCVMLAHESARDLRYDSLDSGCLLLGLLGEETGIAAKALAEQGITIDAVRAQLAAQRPPELKESWEGHIPFTAEAKSALTGAFQEARRLGHIDVATSHVLLGITTLPQSAAARALSALGTDFAELRATVLRHHTLAAEELAKSPDHFRALLREASGWDWPARGSRLRALSMSIIWYAVTLAALVAVTMDTVGPELMLGISALLLIGVLVVMILPGTPPLIRRLSRGNVSSFVDIPPEFRVLLAKWGITDPVVLIKHDASNVDATIRAGRKAWLTLSHDVFHEPQAGRFVLAHELTHLLRNDSYRGRVGSYLLLVLIPAALLSFTPAAWAIMTASLVLHSVAIRWPAEIACDRIAAGLTSYPEMLSALDLRGWRRYFPWPSHPPVALRLAIGLESALDAA